MLERRFFPIFAQASKSIGLDLKSYAGKQLRLLSVPLQGRSQAWDGRGRGMGALELFPSALDQGSSRGQESDWREGGIRAWFAVDDGRVVGAYLTLAGYAPGVVSLADHSEFMPASLSPERLDFASLESVEIIGPWTGSDWRSRAMLTDAAEVRRVLSFLQASSHRSGERFGVQGDEEYMIVLTYPGGEEVRARLVTKRVGGPTFLTFDPGSFSRSYYVPPAELKALVKSVLGAD